MKNPKISVIMPVYNSDSFLRDSILSVLDQSFKDFELIIVNDGSTDKTEKILNSFKDKRIRVIKNLKNLGVARSLNIGLKEAQGEYIARCDADDINEKERFEKEVSFLDEHLDYILVGSQAKLVNIDDKSLGKTNLPQTDKEIRRKIFIRNPMLHPTVMFRKEVLKKVGYYSEELNGAEDYDLWFRISKLGKMENLSEKLIKRRFDKDVVTQKMHLKVELLALIARLKNLPIISRLSLDFVVGFFTFLLYRLWLILGIFQGRAVPPDPDNSYFYISAANHFPIISNFEEYRLALYSAWIKVISVITHTNLEASFMLNFILGTILMFIVIVFLIRSFESNFLKRIVLISFMGLYTGSGAYHGFYWIVPSFYLLLFFFLLVTQVFEKKIKWGWLIPLTVFFIFVHPSSVLFLVLFPLWYLLSFITKIADRQFFKKSLLITISGLVIYLIYGALSKFYPQQFVYTDPSGDIIKLQQILTGHLQLVSWPTIYKEYFNFFLINPLVLIAFLLCLFFSFKQNEKFSLLFISSLLLTLCSSTLDFGYRTLGFLWPLTFIMIGYGLIGLIDWIRKYSFGLSVTIFIFSYLGFFTLMTVFSLIWISYLNSRLNYDWDRNCSTQIESLTDNSIYFLNWDSYYAFITYGYPQKKAVILNKGEFIKKEDYFVAPNSIVNRSESLNPLALFLTSNISRKVAQPQNNIQNYYWYDLSNQDVSKVNKKELIRCGYFSLYQSY